jgi:hypothetical protein
MRAWDTFLDNLFRQLVQFADYLTMGSRLIQNLPIQHRKAPFMSPSTGSAKAKAKTSNEKLKVPTNAKLTAQRVQGKTSTS